MDTARIAVLLEPFLEQSLSQFQLDHISIYIDLLLRWNARINLTAIREREEIVTRHFGESLFMARHLFLESTSISSSSQPQEIQPTPGTASPRVLDIGSGAGFPGLPLKLWAPNIELTLIESNHKKAAFLREVVRALTLTNINVITDRSEAVAANPNFPPADVVTLRAVEHFTTILPQTPKFMAAKARLALLISTPQVLHLETMPQLKWQPPIPIPQSQARVLAIGEHKQKWDM